MTTAAEANLEISNNYRPRADQQPHIWMGRYGRGVSTLAFLFAAVLFTACSSSEDPTDAGSDTSEDIGADLTPDVESDAGTDLLDAEADINEPQSRYSHVQPPDGSVPASLQGEVWRSHWVDDIRPYWMQTAAFGTPEGNFPTYRGMDGSIQSPPERRPRMIARQIFAYSVGFMLTGEERLLQLARAGVDWTIDHARDSRGGCFDRLTEDGSPLGDGPKYAQDTAYCAQGLAAYYFITRDTRVELEILALHDLLFNEMWDDENGRILDGLTADLSEPVYQTQNGASELVAQLDPINAFMLLTQPVLSEESRRDQFLNNMETLANVMIDQFWSDGVFWGLDVNHGQYNTRHVDFGHTLKAYWMILQIDKRLPENPFYDFLMDNVHTQVERAYDRGRWAKRPTSATTVEYGSDWWIYAEEDQCAATLNLIDYRYINWLRQTGRNWLDDYVDTREIGELIPSINRNGSPAWTWPDNDTAKCNLWKNGYHSSEHALVMYLLGRNLERESAELHFAVPSDMAADFVATPYIFAGREVSRTESGDLAVGADTLRHVIVAFDQIY